MTMPTFPGGDSPIHRLDPRVRIVAAAVFAIILALGHNFGALLFGLALAGALAILARLPLAFAARRLLALNLFIALLALTLPASTPGETVGQVFNLTLSREGFLLAGTIALKSNAILLAGMALVSTIETVRLSHALRRLWLPAKLTQLLFLTVRYADVIQREYQSLANGLKVRAFRLRLNWHSLRTIGYVVGTLLLRSFSRSERIMAAMKCRGFHGEFYTLDTLALAWRDGFFMLLSSLLLLIAGWLQWG